MGELILQNLTRTFPARVTTGNSRVASISEMATWRMAFSFHRHIFGSALKGSQRGNLAGIFT
jgi:hypothetical protein